MGLEDCGEDFTVCSVSSSCPVLLASCLQLWVAAVSQLRRPRHHSALRKHLPPFSNRCFFYHSHSPSFYFYSTFILSPFFRPEILHNPGIIPPWALLFLGKDCMGMLCTISHCTTCPLTWQWINGIPFLYNVEYDRHECIILWRSKVLRPSFLYISSGLYLL